jgi:hypothetical protein
MRSRCCRRRIHLLAYAALLPRNREISLEFDACGRWNQSPTPRMIKVNEQDQPRFILGAPGVIYPHGAAGEYACTSRPFCAPDGRTKIFASEAPSGRWRSETDRSRRKRTSWGLRAIRERVRSKIKVIENRYEINWRLKCQWVLVAKVRCVLEV